MSAPVALRRPRGGARPRRGIRVVALLVGALVTVKPTYAIGLAVVGIVGLVVVRDVRSLPVFLVFTMFVESLSLGPSLRVAAQAARSRCSSSSTTCSTAAGRICGRTRCSLWSQRGGSGRSQATSGPTTAARSIRRCPRTCSASRTRSPSGCWCGRPVRSVRLPLVDDRLADLRPCRVRTVRRRAAARVRRASRATRTTSRSTR